MKIPGLEPALNLPAWTHDGGERLAERGTAVVRDITRTLVARASSSSTCGPDNNSAACEKPVGSSTETLPIVLGVVIPISAAIIVFIFLHRRNNKKQAKEDMEDPHKSLDFGLDIDMPPSAANQSRFGGRRGKRNAPEMIITDMSDIEGKRRSRGLSMDMLGSPYMLPAGLAGSRESLHSMSRSVRDEHDPYRPVTFGRHSSETSRSPRPLNENGSTYSGSTIRTGYNDRSNLMVNAQRMSQSYPDRKASFSRTDTQGSEDIAPPTPVLPADALARMQDRTPIAVSSEKALELPATPLDSPSPASPPPTVQEEFNAVPLPPPEPSTAAHRPPRTSSVYVTGPPQTSSVALEPQVLSDRPNSDVSCYSEDRTEPTAPPKIVEPVPVATYAGNDAQETYENHETSGMHGDYDFGDLGYDIDPSMIHTGRHSLDGATPSADYPLANNRVSYMGLRPLPPDHPEENPEQRANRIRSFYKEYFDTSRPNPTSGYYEDFDADYTADYYPGGEGWYDPDTGAYYSPEVPQAPFAQPMARRAMTPPPRGASGPPKFAGAHAYDRHFSSMSGGARGPPRGRAPPKKKLPPPKVLTSLPTPHLLKNDSSIFSSTDFAPPTSFREMQNGRGADSPVGTPRPYSPSVRAYSPLVSSFETLSPVPSPHQLRKSGTFTTLDFSPRFMGREGVASDAGSVRSARSGISALQNDAVRQGAYRVSRIPKEYVTSREDLSKQLRPKMDLISRA